MNTSETIQPTHLGRLAVVYVRQSSRHQVLANKESLKLQYDLQHRACTAGWDQAQVDRAVLVPPSFEANATCGFSAGLVPPVAGWA